MKEKLTTPNFLKHSIEAPQLTVGDCGEIEVMCDEDNKSWYRLRTSCDCSTPEHSLLVDMEWEEEYGASITFYMEVNQLFAADKWFSNLKSKLKFIWKVLTGDKFELSEAFLFRGEKQVNAVLQTLTLINNKMKKRKLNNVDS
jgi:hypothetical protein